MTCFADTSEESVIAWVPVHGLSRLLMLNMVSSPLRIYQSSSESFHLEKSTNLVSKYWLMAYIKYLIS